LGFGFRWRHGGLRILEAEQAFEDGGVGVPAAGFVFGAFLGLVDEVSDVGEGASAAWGEAVGG